MDADAAPVVVGRYALFDRIAVGGMASVHLARQLGPIGFSRVVAVKRLHSQYVHDDAFVEMFVDEARLASRLRHPSVVSVTDVIETGEELLLVMDYVHGVPVSSLREAIARGAIPLPVVSSIVVDVLDGLQAAHDACDEAGQPLRIVHRDISPHNVLVGVDGIARIIDFGIAKATDRVQTTRDGQIKGKIRYMAPEQLSGDEVDARSDVYSAAVMLWELLSGRALVSQDDMGAMVRRVLFESLPRPRHPTERLSAELVAVTMRGLERAPDDRYATAAEMARALREAVEPAPREEVGAWLGEAASGTLEEHRSLLRRVELAPLPDSDTSGLSGALRRVVDRQLRAEEVTEVEALAEAASADHVSEDTATRLGATEILVGAAEPPATSTRPDERRRRFALVVVAAAVGGALAFFAAPAERETSATSFAHALDRLADDLEPAATPISAPAPTAAPEASATVSASTAPPPPSPRWASPPRPVTPPRPSPASCNPPYTYVDGVKRFKTHCL